MQEYNNLELLTFFEKINELSEKINSLSNQKNKDSLNKILNNMKIVLINYPTFFDDYLNDEFRYIDYFSTEHNKEETIIYFKQYYTGNDIEDRLIGFILFVCLHYFNQILDATQIFSEYEFSEVVEILNTNNFYDKLLYFSSQLIQLFENKKNNENLKLPFLEENKYKIFFTGLSLDDIEDLETNVKMQLIKKLTSPLSTEVVIKLSESVDHVKDLYDFPLQRIQFANDYRIAFIRVENVTVVLGVTIKTGKDIDYTRYDSVAKKQDLIYQEVADFRNGTISQDSDHYKVIAILEKAYKNKKR